MTLVTWLGLGVWLGVLGAVQLSAAPVGWTWATVVLLGLSLLWRRSGVVFALGLCLGVVAVQRAHPGPVLRGPASVHGVVAGAPMGGTADLEVWRVGTPHGGWAPAAGRVRLRMVGRAPPPGTEIVAWGDARPISGPSLPGAPDRLLSARVVGARSELLVRDAGLVGVAPVAPLPVPARHGGVLRALALGDRRLLDPQVTARLRGTGTSHLLAISGFHVGVVAGVVGGGVALLLRAVAVVRQRGVSLRPAWVLAASAAVIYAVVAGAPVSAQRAALLVVLAALIRVLGARPRPMPLIAAAASILLVMDPAAAWSPSFQLSFGAVLGLARFGAELEQARPLWWPGWLRWMWTSLCLTLAATLGTLPAVGWWFQALAPGAPLANLVAVPLTTFGLAPLAAVAVLAPAPLDGWAYLAGDRVVDLLVGALAWFEGAPVPVAWGTGAALALAVALVLHRRWAWCLAIALVLAPPAPPPTGLRVTWPDVGQGTAALVEWPDGRRWLVDGGPPSQAVLHWLRRRRVHHLDVVIAAHGQADHAGGLAPVIRGLSVGELWVPRSSRDDPQLKEAVLAALEREVPVIPGPPPDLASKARAVLPLENDRGVVVAPSWRGRAVLLPADVEADGEEALLSALRGSGLSVVAVAVPHHGSRTSSTPALLDATRPEIAVVQAGRFSRFGHPAPHIVDRWSAAGARLWHAGLDGTIELTVGRDDLAVRTWRADRGWQREARVPLRGAPWQRAGLEVAAARSR